MTSNPIVLLFYRRIIAFDASREPGPQVEEAVQLLAQATGSTGVYLELFDDEHAPQFTRSIGLDANDQLAVRDLVSRGPIAHAVAVGRIFEASATSTSLRRVAATADRALVCVPITRDSAAGLVYLHSRKPKFSVADIELAAALARGVLPLVEEIVPSKRTLDERMLELKRQVIRQELRRNGWNMTVTARALGVGRAVLYRALRRD